MVEQCKPKPKSEGNVAVTPNSSPEELETFRQRVLAQWADEDVDLHRMAQDPVEQALHRRVVETYEEACRIERMHQYPNGLPADQQFRWDLWLWDLALNAMAVWRATGKPPPQ